MAGDFADENAGREVQASGGAKAKGGRIAVKVEEQEEAVPNVKAMRNLWEQRNQAQQHEGQPQR